MKKDSGEEDLIVVVARHLADIEKKLDAANETLRRLRISVMIVLVVLFLDQLRDMGWL